MEMSTEATKGLEMLRAPCRWESQSTVLIQQWGLRKYFSVVPLSADQQQKRYLKFISSMFVFLVGWGCLFFSPNATSIQKKQMIWVCTTGIALGRSPLEQNESLMFQFSHYRMKIKMEVKIMLCTQMHWWESSFSFSLMPGVSNTGRKGLGKQLRRKSSEER